MQDDFGDFHQAPSAMMHGPPPTKQNGSLTMDLNSKIMQSFDLSGSSQKASVSFQYKPRQMGKRPPSMQYRPSSSAADWKNLDVKTSDFTAPKQAPQSQRMQQPGYPASFNTPVPNAVQSASYQQVPGNFPPAYPNYGVPSQVLPMQNVNNFQNIANNHSSVDVSNSFGAFANPPPFQQNFQVPSSNELPISNFYVPQNVPGANVENNLSNFNYFQQSDNAKMNNQTGTSFIESSSQEIYNTSNEITLPPWMTKPNDIPQLYKNVLKLCATPNSYADTARLYPILLSSKLPTDVLGHIWSAANQSVPGQLTFSEVYIALGLVALAQKGELNLSVKYVTNLKAAPIPSLDLATSFTENMTSKSNNNLVSNAEDDDFADFQSVPHSNEAVMFQSSGINSQNHSAEFQKYQSSVPECSAGALSNDPAPYQSSSLNKTNGGLLNLSGAFQTEGNKTKNNKHDLYKKDLFASSGFINTGDAKKSDLNIINPKSNVMPSSNSSTLAGNGFNGHVSKNITSDPTDDEFGDFKTSVFVSSVSNKSKPAPSHGKNSTTDIFAMATPTSTQITQKNLIGDQGSDDRYSALRDLTSSLPSISTESGELETDDFADFQSVQPQQTTEVAFASETFPSTTLKAPFGKNVFEKEDSNSVSSLELPSLSKTISSLSIGSMSPVKTAEEPYWGFVNDNTGVAAGKPPITKESFDTNIGFSAQSSSAAMATSISLPDDGLYSLDEPISPPSHKRIASEKIYHENKQKVPTLKTKKKVIVPRPVSEADDFGDFSSGPPPMDDTPEHANSEFDMFQAGNSSLVDFDAFGHFQEAKEESKKKPEIKRNREESTAFTEYVASQNIAEKSDTSEIVDDTPVENFESNHDSKEDWSGYDYRDTQHKTINLEGEFAAFADEITIKQKNTSPIVNESPENESSTIRKPWKLESTISEESNNIEQEYTKWDAEGEDMKARMEGTDAIGTKDLYTDHWGRCLATCKDIILSTSEIFSALNSPSVCHEIVNSTRGKTFISCTSEVYGIARRICKGMKSVNLSDDDLEQTLKEIEIAWNNLLGFCPYTPSVHKTPEHCSSTPKSGQSNEHNIACSLCLLSIADSSLAGLEYGGKSYHAPCANLWLNQIAPILPRLDVATVF